MEFETMPAATRHIHLTEIYQRPWVQFSDAIENFHETGLQPFILILVTGSFNLKVQDADASNF